MRAFHRLLATLACLLALAPSHANDAIVAEGLVDAPVGEVWSAWTTAAGLRSWLAPKVDIDLRIDGLLRVNASPTGTLGDAATIENRILAFEPERMLAIRVSRAPADFPFRDEVAAMWTVLSLEAAPEGRTRVRIVGLGFAPDERSRRMRAFFEQGNAFTLARLQQRFRR